MSDPLDLLTLAEAKQAISVAATDVSRDTQIAMYITAVSRLLDQRAGPTVARTITESHNGGGSFIRLRLKPVRSITSITEYISTTPTVLSATTAGTQPANGYLAEPYRPDPTLYSGKVRRVTAGHDLAFACGRLNIVAVYSAGRVQSTTSVDARFKEAAGICLENLWRERQQSARRFDEYEVPVQSFPTFALAKGAADLLADEIYYQRPMRAG